MVSDRSCLRWRYAHDDPGLVVKARTRAGKADFAIKVSFNCGDSLQAGCQCKRCAHAKGAPAGRIVLRGSHCFVFQCRADSFNHLGFVGGMVTAEALGQILDEMPITTPTEKSWAYHAFARYAIRAPIMECVNDYETTRARV